MEGWSPAVFAIFYSSYKKGEFGQLRIVPFEIRLFVYRYYYYNYYCYY